MSRLAFCSIPGVVVSNAEYQSWLHASKGLPEAERALVSVGTASLLDYLHTTEPHVDFSFCLGADAFMDLTADKWKESKRVLQLLEGRLLVLHRQQKQQQQQSSIVSAEEDHAAPNKDEHIVSLLQQRIAETPGARLLQMDQLDAVSSSQVRACRNETELATLVVPDVLAYIKEHKLYQFANDDETK